MLETAAGWRIEGINDSATFARLFLAGAVPALLARRDLPPSPAAEVWGARALAEGVSFLERHVAPDDEAAAAAIAAFERHVVAEGPLDVTESAELTGAGRAAVALRRPLRDPDDYPPRLWLVLDAFASGGLRLRSTAATLTMGTLLAGLQIVDQPGEEAAGRVDRPG